MKTAKLWSLVGCLGATLLILHARGDVDHVPPSTPLDRFPETLDGLKSQDIPLSTETLEVLGKGYFLNRIYSAPDPAVTGSAPGGTRQHVPVQLFIAYFPTQRSGQSIHSPQNCLPGSGWSFLSSGVTTFTDSTGKAYRVGDYVISNGRDKQEVLYWYQSHGRSIANDYAAKLAMLTDAIRYGRTDAALVRVISAVMPNESPEAAHARVVALAKTVTPLLPAYVPD